MRVMVIVKANEESENEGMPSEWSKEQLAMLEEELLFDSDDDQAMYLLSQGTERLADMWLMESLLDRLSRNDSHQSDNGWTNSMFFQPSRNSANSSTSRASN